MLPPYQPWPDCWPSHIPCIFSRTRAQENYDYLRRVMGAWVEKAAARRDNHPLITDWRWGGPESYIRLNTLAEDLRVVENVPGLAPIVAEMRQSKAFQPAAHTVHTAALFHRGGNSLTKFFSPSNNSIPDYELTLLGKRAAVEAKQLTQSELQRSFAAKAMLIQNAIVASVFTDGTDYPEVHVIVKNPADLPSSSEVIEAVRAALALAAGGNAAQLRGVKFNVFVLAFQANPAFRDRITLQLASRRADTEDERVERLLNKANKQLKKNTGGADLGIMCLAITEQQDPRAVAALFGRRFSGGQFRNTSGVVIHRYATHRGGGPRGTVDLVAYVANPNAHIPLAEFSLRGVGVTAELLANTSDDGTISCYSVGVASGRVTRLGSGGMGLNPLFRLAPDAFS